jgi:hypothetical protein
VTTRTIRSVSARDDHSVKLLVLDRTDGGLYRHEIPMFSAIGLHLRPGYHDSRAFLTEPQNGIPEFESSYRCSANTTSLRPVKRGCMYLSFLMRVELSEVDTDNLPRIAYCFN